MRISRTLVVLFGLSALIAGPGLSFAAESTTASVVVTAQFASRTSLRVSTELLRFEVSASDAAPVAIIDVSAAARTRQGGDVVLTVERAGTLDGRGGAADVETSLSFSNTGDGITAGELQQSSPSVAARWAGSGLRTARLAFTLRSPVSGTYLVPVRFVLSAP